MTRWLHSHSSGFAKTGLALALALALALVALVLGLSQIGWLSRWDWLFYDWSLSSQSRAPAKDIVIVAIDEQSLRNLGRWPWSRQVHAELVRKLTASGAKAVALDIVFGEPDLTDPAADSDLAAALADYGRAVLPVLDEQTRLNGQLIETLPIPILAKAAARLGHVDVELDPDNIARSVYLKAGLGSPRWSTLALALLEVVDPDAGQTLPGQRASTIHSKSSSAWQRDYHILIPFAGPTGHFQQMSYHDVLRGEVPATTFHDKWVLVGVTATGLGDALPTPVSAQAQPMPGVEFNANILDALLRGVAIQPLSRGSALLLTGVLVLLSWVMHAIYPPRWMLPLTGLALLLTGVISFTLLQEWHRWFPPMAALVAQGISYPLWIGWRWREARRALRAEQERTQVTLYSIDDAVIVTDAQGHVESLNPKAESLLGWVQTAAQGQPLGAIFRLAHDPEHRSLLDLATVCLQQNQEFRLSEESFLVSRNGQEYAVRASAAPIRNSQGQASGMVIAFSDITENRRLTQQMTYQATHDGLTQLPNRHLLQDRLKRAIARARRAGQGCAVLCVDLDHFKKVNDGLGHTAGDTLLRAVATRLLTPRGCGEGAIFRLGSDEFFVVLENLRQEHQAALFARKILNVLAPCFEIDGHECFITASIGISLFPKDGENEEALLKNANIAMHRAKDNGRNMIQFYSQDMHIRALERLTLEQSLRHALERQELEVHYQPQMDLHNGRIIGVEALLRWRHAQRGLISPIEFVPLAEETGLIEIIGEWVLQTACEQARTWQREGFPLRMAVNLSPRQFLRPGMVDMIRRVLRETGLEPRYLDLEITEGLFMKDVESCIATLHVLKQIGVHLSIDDFGTGYSSLSYLRRFPVDQLKIDKSFVSNDIASQGDMAIAKAVIAMAHSMQLKVIAEGVENPVQLAFLQQHQCDEIQGYYLSRPAPAQQIRALLRGESPSAALQDPNSRRSLE
ncbi:MAG: EAL domain-containing protein [Candidatus Competibacteraceae bacterium]|nr:EAL domain-containing protein [Candidatus Competibacteraceae bacterium]HRY14813.1 EAL domain-containing protein [Candidatus Competibacteraceae bacterium]